MAWWLTIYCCESVAGISADQLSAGIRGDDPDTPAGIDYERLCENYHLSEPPNVDDMLEHLRVTPVSGQPLDFEINFTAAATVRPIVLHLWRDAQRVSEELAEARDEREPPSLVLGDLDRCVEVVGVELGFNAIGTVGVVVAYEVARYLAQKGSGVAVDDECEWWRVENGALCEVE